MTMNAAGLLDALITHAQTLGVFDRVAGSEPANAPGRGLTCAPSAGLLQPIQRRSGLATTSARLAIQMRIYRPLTGVDDDNADSTLLAAADALIGSIIGDVDLGEAVEVDVFGAHGPGLSAKPGYLQQDEATLRVIDITVPIIVDDLWPQAR